MDKDNVFITTDVTLYALQVLDFKTDEGLIQGYKLYYVKNATGDYKENYLGGKAEHCFIKDENYRSVVDKIKMKQFPIKAKIKYEVQSVDKPPKPVLISF